MKGFAMSHLLKSVLIFSALSACGCARMEAKHTEHLIDYYGPSCEKLGYQKGTENFGSCVIQLSRRQPKGY